MNEHELNVAMWHVDEHNEMKRDLKQLREDIQGLASSHETLKELITSRDIGDFNLIRELQGQILELESKIKSL